MVNLELYKIFVTVAKFQNITKASEKLNISQPVVSTHIKNLENILGVNLFNRTNKGLELTKIRNGFIPKYKRCNYSFRKYTFKLYY